jgi:ankyrin repeat protein
MSPKKNVAASCGRVLIWVAAVYGLGLIVLGLSIRTQVTAEQTFESKSEGGFIFGSWYFSTQEKEFWIEGRNALIQALKQALKEESSERAAVDAAFDSASRQIDNARFWFKSAQEAATESQRKSQLSQFLLPIGWAATFGHSPSDIARFDPITCSALMAGGVCLLGVFLVRSGARAEVPMGTRLALLCFLSFLLGLPAYLLVSQNNPDPPFRTGLNEEDIVRAAWLGKTGVIGDLIAKGTNINWRDGYGNTALIHAAAHGQISSVKMLIERGADVNIKDSAGYTALIAGSNHPDVEKLLATAGANVNARTPRDGWTALLSATDPTSESGFHSATTDPAEIMRTGGEGSMLAVVKALLEKGADPNGATNSGITPLMHAAADGNNEVVQLLLERGADVNARSNGEGGDWSWCISDRDFKVGNKPQGITALMCACHYYGNVHTVEMLLHKGADAKARTGDGLTALKIAKKHDNSRVSDLLMKYGAVDE